MHKLNVKFSANKTLAIKPTAVKLKFKTEFKRQR